MTPKAETLTAYPASYHEAREAFRRAAQELNAQIETHVVLSGAKYGGDLTIDVALVGVANPDWSLVLSSGLHGVEGFFGSAIQTAYMRHMKREDVINSKGQLVLIHSINPFGFFGLRRVNEDNIDLNRNFLVRRIIQWHIAAIQRTRRFPESRITSPSIRRLPAQGSVEYRPIWLFEIEASRR